MEKKKIGLIIIALFAIVATATAWNLGNTLTPIEFADTDLSQHNFNPTPTNNEIIGTGEGALYRMNYEIDTYEKQTDSENYEEKNKTKHVQYSIKDYSLCRFNGKSEAECLTPIKSAGIAGVISGVENELATLTNQQITAKAMALYANELTPNSINITAQEIVKP